MSIDRARASSAPPGTFTAYDRQEFTFDGTAVYEKRRLVEGGQTCVAQVFVDRRGMYLWVIELVTGERGRGTGTRLLAHLCAECDRRGLTLRLTAVGDTTAATNRLLGWYARHGFVVLLRDDAGGYLLRRLPR